MVCVHCKEPITEGMLCAACVEKFLAERTSRKELEKKIEQLKREATEAVLAEYEEVSKRCAQCKSVRKRHWKGGLYCEEHGAKIDAEIDARHSEIDAKFGQVSEPPAAPGVLAEPPSAAPYVSVEPEAGAVRAKSPADPGVSAEPPSAAPDGSVGLGMVCGVCKEPVATGMLCAACAEEMLAQGLTREALAKKLDQLKSEAMDAFLLRQRTKHQHAFDASVEKNEATADDAGGAKPSEAPAAAVESAPTADGVGDGKQPDAVPAALLCQKCHAVPASVDSRFCDGCTKKLQAEELEFIATKKQKKEEAWKAEYEKEQAAKKRMFAAEGAAIQEWHVVTSRCKECISAKKTQLHRYCNEHQRAIDESIEKYLAGR
jgi:hypothetical protein